MEDHKISTTALNPWHPITNSLDLKHLGKLGEELNECGSAVSRCIIQGVLEKEPTTGKLNKNWLEDEVADVLANFDLVIARFNLDRKRITERRQKKYTNLKSWHDMA